MLTQWTPRVLSVLRVVSAFLFMQHGAQKMFGFPAPQRSPFDLFSMYGVAGTLEFVGGFLLLIGLFTRPVAFVLSGMMAVAYWMFHAPASIYPVQNGGDAAILFCFVFLYIAAAGGGPWSVDNALRKKA